MLTLKSRVRQAYINILVDSTSIFNLLSLNKVKELGMEVTLLIELLANIANSSKINIHNTIVLEIELIDLGG